VQQGVERGRGEKDCGRCHCVGKKVNWALLSYINKLPKYIMRMLICFLSIGDIIGVGGIGMPDIRNCKRCGRLFNYIGGRPICQDCKKQDEEEFKRVKEYLYEHPKASIIEVSNALDISVQKIRAI